MSSIGSKHIIDIGPSRSLGILLCLANLSALALIAVYSLDDPHYLCLVLPLLWNWIDNWSTHVSLSGGRAVVRLEWGADGQWRLIERSGICREAALAERNYISSWMTLLCFLPTSGARRYLILTKDNCDLVQLRRLRVRLWLSRPNSTP
ncbi:MAG: hypothetical protein KDI27_01350 [Gammaproteobacteria bacterium]|nr:hypothetical protein [Gammaproteobacteria bacterium]MCP5418143.1 hypothetical protein [Chromatiaceae bacterium]